MSIAEIDFSAQSARRAAVRRAASAMARDGAVRLSGIFSKSVLRAVRDEVAKRMTSGELRKHGLVRDIGGRYAATVPFQGALLKPAFYANPNLMAMLDALLGSSYCIGSLEVVVAAPGSSEQHQHIDGPLRFDRVFGGKKKTFDGDLSHLPPYAVTLAVPLCDVTLENGPTAIWRGSHRTALLPRPPGRNAVDRDFPVEQMTGKFGSAFLFDFRTYHGGTPNYSREERPLMMFVFTRTWFRDPNLQEVGPSVVIADSDYRRVPGRLKPLFLLAPAARRRLWTRPRASVGRRE